MTGALIQISLHSWINTRYIVHIHIQTKDNKTDVVITDRNKVVHYIPCDTETAAREFVDDIVNKHNETTISEDE